MFALNGEWKMIWKRQKWKRVQVPGWLWQDGLPSRACLDINTDDTTHQEFMKIRQGEQMVSSLWTDTPKQQGKELCPAQIKDRDHVFPILKVKGIFPTTHVQKGFLKNKKEGASPYSK